jgi:hypothetical protein
MTPAVGRSRLPVVRVRGKSRDHDFELIERPPDLGVEEAIEAHRVFVELHQLSPMKLAP